MDTKLTYIYFLHKGNNIPFYIGKSINKNLHRSYQHKKTYGKDTLIEIIDIVENKDWKFWESYWIEQFKQWGFSLENKNNGGGGPLKYTEYSKKLKSESMKKIWGNGNFKRNWSKPILHIPTGKIYPTIKSAKIDLSISWPKIYLYLKNKEIFKYI
jgi:hypothetical protein